MKKQACDLCGSGNLISGYKVKRDGSGWWQKIDICRRCWDILYIALNGKDMGVEIKHKGLVSEICGDKPDELMAEISNRRHEA